MMILTAAAMLVAACSSSDDDAQQQVQPGTGWSEYVTVTAGTPGNGPGSGSGANAPLRVKVNTANPQKSLWETGDQLTIWTGRCTAANMSKNGFTLTSGADTDNGTFSGRLISESAPTSTTTLYAVIDNGSDAIEVSEDGTSVTANLATQVGATADKALDYELYHATSTNSTRNFRFTHKMALIKWTIKVNGAAAGDKCDIVLSGTGLKNAAQLNPTNGDLTVGSADGTITLENVVLNAGNTELFVVLPPCTVSSGITAELTMTSGSKVAQVATGTLGVGSITVAGNKYYTAGTNEFSLDYAHVDLGLSSGTKWATINVGASKPEDYGDYFAWGETEPYYTDGNAQNTATTGIWKAGKEEYGYYLNSYFDTYNGTSFTKYNWTSGKTELESGDDAATRNWGTGWRMPTENDWIELLNAYPSSSTSGSKRRAWLTNYNSTGVKGLAFYDASNNILLFLPAAGWRNYIHLSYLGQYGRYWSSSLATSMPSRAWILDIDPDYSTLDDDDRWDGLPVRPVCAQ